MDGEKKKKKKRLFGHTTIIPHIFAANIKDTLELLSSHVLGREVKNLDTQIFVPFSFLFFAAKKNLSISELNCQRVKR